MQGLTEQQQAELEKLRASVAQIQSGGGGTEDGRAETGRSYGTDQSTAVSPTGVDAVDHSSDVSEPDVRSEADDGHNDESAGNQNEQYSKARSLVLRKLTAAPKSRYQLAQALREKEFSETIITQVLDRMEQVQLIDDAEFARSWVRTRHELKGLGSSVLRRELRGKGIADHHADGALEQISPEDELAAARELIEGKLRGVSVPVGAGADDRKEREKITRRLVNALARRGHSPGLAFSLVREELDSRKQ